jgi:hypothetical protein
MGRLAWELSKKVAAGRWIRFEIVRSKEAGKEETEDVLLDGAGLIAGGTFILNDTSRAPAFLAKLTVSREVEAVVGS